MQSNSILLWSGSLGFPTLAKEDEGTKLTGGHCGFRAGVSVGAIDDGQLHQLSFLKFILAVGLLQGKRTLNI